MARPERHDVDYFPFFVKRGRTLNILQSKYGLEGIGFFTNLMRFLSLAPDHHYCIKDETDRMNFFAEIGVQDENKGIEMIELMVKTAKFDKELWDKYQVIASEAFLVSLEEAYKQRKNKIISLSEIKEKYVSKYGNSDNEHGNPATDEFPSENKSHNPQSKVKKSKVKKTISEAEPPSVDQTPPLPKPEKPRKLPLREREPVNDMECVEKTYLQNWDSLYAQSKVKAVNPVVNWNQTRKLLKTHFENIAPDLIIQAVNNGLKDDFVMKCGYSLATILSASVLNRLINTGGSEQPKHLITADNIPQSDVSRYFREAT